MPAAPARPAVLGWYNAYCAAMALLYVACIGLGVAAILFRDKLADPKNPSEMFVVLGVSFVLLGMVLAVAYGAAPFLPAKPWAWVYHIVLIAIGMTSACCVPVCIPLLIFWFKDETKAWFGRS
jgi:hypothetical protein